MDTSTRRVRHDVADGVTLMGFSFVDVRRHRGLIACCSWGFA